MQNFINTALLCHDLKLWRYFQNNAEHARKRHNACARFWCVCARFCFVCLHLCTDIYQHFFDGPLTIWSSIAEIFAKLNCVVFLASTMYTQNTLKLTLITLDLDNSDKKNYPDNSKAKIEFPDKNKFFACLHLLLVRAVFFSAA